jgi:4'-phosphopantetheinyl transferase
MNKLVWEIPPRNLRISRSEIHVWKIYLNATLKENQNRINLLSKEEHKRLNSFKFEKDRFRYKLTHSMKRWVLAHYLNELPEKLNFTLGKQGKPAISAAQNWLNLKFNISHSHQIILMGITLKDPIGIDIEYHAENISTENLGKIIFSPNERQFFSKLTCQQEKRKAFFRCWTRKEAYLKAKGYGITNYLTKISVDMNELPTKDWIKFFMGNENTHWKLFPLSINKFYTAAMVSTCCKTSIKYYNL